MLQIDRPLDANDFAGVLSSCGKFLVWVGAVVTGVYGFVVMARGRLKLSRKKTLQGNPARTVGTIIFLIPLAAIAAHFAFLDYARKSLMSEQLRDDVLLVLPIVVFLVFGVIAFCVATSYEAPLEPKSPSDRAADGRNDPAGRRRISRPGRKRRDWTPSRDYDDEEAPRESGPDENS
jgi:hypothetical protein